MHAPDHTALETAFDSVRPTKAAVTLADGTRAGRSKLDVRLSLPWFGQRYYVRLLSGSERRNARRLDGENQSGLTKISIFYGLALFLFFASAVFGAAIFLYLVKSMLGINLFEARSPLHRFFF